MTMQFVALAVSLLPWAAAVHLVGDDYSVRPLVKEEGADVGGNIEPVTNVAACKAACTSNSKCNSFTVCQSYGNTYQSGCYFKDKVISDADATSENHVSLDARQCKTYFKQAEPLDSVAVCSFGGLRTFAKPDAHGSLIDTLRILKHNSKRVDYFIFATINDAEEKKQICWDFDPVTSSKSEAEAVLREKVRPEVDNYEAEFVESSGDITEANVDEFVDHREKCFSGGFWTQKVNFVRSLNQWDHNNKCLSRIVRREEKDKMRYEAVMLVRPDLYIPVSAARAPILGVPWDLAGKLQAVANRQKDHDRRIVKRWDHIALFNRKIMDRYLKLMDIFKHCAPGQACCGAMYQSEDVAHWVEKGLEKTNMCSFNQTDCANTNVVRGDNADAQITMNDPKWCPAKAVKLLLQGFKKLTHFW
eukprot:TRINITY_DN1284_c0_g2_i1.p1 TRINITY_DN1284_c0_g2~~TRINITY_DN1284_c0_g2_i1.p1  ORF type:complete len:417 (+),score=65.69 TRINITY_DN1284_c0_g2_i1:39-1289(+)